MAGFIAILLCIVVFGGLCAGAIKVVKRKNWPRTRSLLAVFTAILIAWMVSIYVSLGVAAMMEISVGHAALDFLGPYCLCSFVVAAVVLGFTLKSFPRPSPLDEAPQ